MHMGVPWHSFEPSSKKKGAGYSGGVERTKDPTHEKTAQLFLSPWCRQSNKTKWWIKHPKTKNDAERHIETLVIVHFSSFVSALKGVSHGAGHCHKSTSGTQVLQAEDNSLVSAVWIKTFSAANSDPSLPPHFYGTWDVTRTGAMNAPESTLARNQ